MTIRETVEPDLKFEPPCPPDSVDKMAGQLPPNDEIRDTLLSIWRAGVAAVDGQACTSGWLSGMPDFVPTHIASVGKAAAAMAAGALAQLPVTPETLVITKSPCDDDRLTGRSHVTLLEASHPVPDETSLHAGKALLDFVSGIGRDGNLLLLVSGGTSALTEVLIEGHSLSDLERLNRDLLARALSITEMNQQRNGLSRIKGGRLLRCFSGKRVHIAAVSDVPGDDIAVIGSGTGDPALCRVQDTEAEIIACNAVARSSAALAAEQRGFAVRMNSECLHGELGAVADLVAGRLIDGPAGIYIFGGEPYLDLPDNPGEGGRNQALALAVARRIAGRNDIAFLSAGTDGGDGPGVAAGGFVTGRSWLETPGGDLAIQCADSGTWLRASGNQIVTGPMATNVMDLAVGCKV